MIGKSLLYKWTKIMQKVSSWKNCLITRIYFLLKAAVDPEVENISNL